MNWWMEWGSSQVNPLKIFVFSWTWLGSSDNISPWFDSHEGKWSGSCKFSSDDPAAITRKSPEAPARHLSCKVAQQPLCRVVVRASARTTQIRGLIGFVGVGAKHSWCIFIKKIQIKLIWRVWPAPLAPIDSEVIQMWLCFEFWINGVYLPI